MRIIVRSGSGRRAMQGINKPATHNPAWELERSMPRGPIYIVEDDENLVDAFSAGLKALK